MQWTKETLRAHIIDMQRNIDLITRQSNFTVIQRRILLDFRKKAQAATRAFMEAHIETQDTYPLNPTETQYVLEQYNAYFNAIERQKNG
jgi:hypothetical protein